MLQYTVNGQYIYIFDVNILIFILIVLSFLLSFFRYSFLYFLFPSLPNINLRYFSSNLPMKSLPLIIHVIYIYIYLNCHQNITEHSVRASNDGY